MELKDIRPGTIAHQSLRYTISAWQEVNQMLETEDIQIYDICRRVEAMLAQAQHADLKTVQESQMMKLLTLSQTTPRLGQERNREFLARFLELQTAATQPDHRGTENEDPFAHHQGMTFSTIHSAKGMQWKLVWVADAIDDSMPGHNWEQSAEKDLEEQRVFYVAATRATDQLHFCCARFNDEGGETQPSRFLDSLEDLLEERTFMQGEVDEPKPPWINNQPETNSQTDAGSQTDAVSQTDANKLPESNNLLEANSQPDAGRQPETNSQLTPADEPEERPAPGHGPAIETIASLNGPRPEPEDGPEPEPEIEPEMT